MIWLDICDQQGNLFYFDIQHVERRRRGRRWQESVSGICGNGLFEVTVLIEPGNEGDVTYVDFSAGSFAGRELLAGVDAAALKADLLAVARRHCGLEDETRRYPHAWSSDASGCHEPQPYWQRGTGELSS